MTTATATSNWQIGDSTAPKPPKVPGLPYLGIALKMRQDLTHHLISLHQQYGNIFRITLLGRDITVMAGINANRFLNTDGNDVFTSEPLFSGFAREMNASAFLTAMDGEEHLHLRKLLRRGYSRSAMVPHMDYLVGAVDGYTKNLKAGDRIQVFPSLQRLVTQQLGQVMTNHWDSTYFEDVKTFLRYMLYVHVLKIYPKVMLRLPRYQRSRARTLELARKILISHRENPTTEDKERDLIDDIITFKDLEGIPYDEDTLTSLVVGPYLAGIDTVASSLSFFIYAVLKHPEVYQQAQAEAKQIFAKGTPNLHDLKDMDVLHGAAIETLRIYPVAPMTPRTAMKSFTFEGYRVDAGSEVFVAQTMTHFMEEYFPNPHVFDPSRFARGEGKGVAGAFAPYSLGQHLCLGAGIAETQMMLTLARLLNNLDLELVHPNITIQNTPLPNPSNRFYVRVVNNHTA